MAVERRNEGAATEIASPGLSVSKLVDLDVANGVATIRLDHPPRNVIDLRVAAELHDAALEVGDREDIGAVVVWGGGRIFLAGGGVGPWWGRAGWLSRTRSSGRPERTF